MINNEHTLDEDIKEVCKIFNEILDSDFAREVYMDMYIMGYSYQDSQFYVLFEVLKKEMPETFGDEYLEYNNKQKKWMVKK